MSFSAPGVLWLLAALPVLLAAYLLAERRSRRAARGFVSAAMVPNVVRARPRWRRHVPPALLLTAVGLLVVGFADPQAVRTVRRERATIVLVLDTSKSMEATDVAPSRLEAARRAARAFIARVPQSFRIGIVGFGRRARVLSAPTTDRVALRSALRDIETTYGTVLGDGMVAGLESIPDLSEGEPAALVVLSDGQESRHGEVDAFTAAERAARAGVAVHTVLMGDPGEDQVARGSPDARTMRTIAEATGGRFFNASSAGEIVGVYRELGTRLSRVRERTPLAYGFVGGALALFGVAVAAAALWFRRAP